MQMSLPKRFLRLGFKNVHEAALVGRYAYFGPIEISFSVGQGHFIARLEAEYPNCMGGLFFGQFSPRLDVGGLEYGP